MSNATPAEPIGSPNMPIKLRCTAVLFRSNDKALLDLIDQTGRRYCFELSYSQARLHASDCGVFVAKVA